MIRHALITALLFAAAVTLGACLALTMFPLGGAPS